MPSQEKQPSSETLAPPAENETALDSVAKRFLEHLASARGASEYTVRNYRQALSEFQNWHLDEWKTPPAWANLGRDDFRSYLRCLGRRNLGRSAVHLRFSALRSFYKFLVREGDVEGMPIKNIALPKQPKRLPQFLTKQQMLDLLAAPRKLLPPDTASETLRKRALCMCLRDEAIFETFYSCGLRISEICGLKVEDLDAREGLVRVRGKGKKERLVPIGDMALKTIAAYRSQLPGETKAGPLFLSPRGEQAVCARDIQRKLKKYLAGAGLDPALTPHKLRHSYATHMLDAGADLRSVQELLGHAHLTSTQVYTHVTTERLKRAYAQSHPRA